MAPKITVIVATYNSGSGIDDLLRSLHRQTMPKGDFEVVFSDDDSTDGTRERLEELARVHVHFTVLHNSPNSGWPGRPRNIAIDVARGEYVLFVDHDDWLSPRALEHLWAYAAEHDSDVVIAKEVGHGHSLPWNLFARNIADGRIGVDPVLANMSPHKLFRRALLDENGIRFPEGRVRLEDHQFVVPALFAAKVISIYSDYPCYHWVRRGRGNASRSAVHPDVYYEHLSRVLDIVDAHTEPGPLRNQLHAQWYHGKMLRALRRRGFTEGPEQERLARYQAIRSLAVRRFDPGVDDFLSQPDRLRSALLRADRLDDLLALARSDHAITVRARLTELGWRDGRLALSVAMTLVYGDGSAVWFDKRGDQITRVLPFELSSAGLRDDVLDVTDLVPRAGASFALRYRKNFELFLQTATSSAELVPDGAHHALTITASVAIDPAVAARGKPLPAGVMDLLMRYRAVGFGAELVVPFDADLAGAGASCARPIARRLVTAYPTSNSGTLAIGTRKMPSSPKPKAPKPAARNTSSRFVSGRRIASIARRLVRVAARPRT